MTDAYFVSEENLPVVIETIVMGTFKEAPTNPLIVFGMDFVKNSFKTAFSFIEEEASYAIDEVRLVKWLENLHKAVLDDALKNLVDEGLIEMLWDGEQNDFVFRVSKKGEEVAKEWSK